MHWTAHQDALSPAALETIRQGCDTTIRRVVEHDPQRRGNRDSHRYSFANSAVHFGCAAEWSVLIDCEPVLKILASIWGSPAFTCSGIGGDFVLPGAVEYQNLHRDGSPTMTLENGGTIDTRNLSPFLIVVNYPMVVKPGEPTGHTAHNGVTRFVRGTHNSYEEVPSLENEPRWMKLAVTAPAPAGCAMIRDVRTWHGGTPVRTPVLRVVRCPASDTRLSRQNLSQDVRAIPSAGFLPPWCKSPRRFCLRLCRRNVWRWRLQTRPLARGTGVPANRRRTGTGRSCRTRSGKACRSTRR